MTNYLFNNDKAFATILYVVTRLHSIGKLAGFHKISKIIYFAEQQHLANYGLPMTGDKFIKMNFGPVPSKIYDILKNAKRVQSDMLRIEKGHYVVPLIGPDMDELAESDVICLDQAIDKYKDYSFDSLTEISHGVAYNMAPLNREIPIVNIAIEGGAREEIVKYIETVIENSNSLHNEFRGMAAF